MWGDHYALEKEPVSDICFLLITFLSGLNEPLMDPTITLPFYKWVVEPSSRRDHEARTRIAKQMKEDLEDRTTVEQTSMFIPTTSRFHGQRLICNDLQYWRSHKLPSLSFC